MRILDFDRLEAMAPALSAEFRTAKPFSHIVIDGFLPEGAAEGVLEEFERPAKDWDYYFHYNEKKLAITDLAAVGSHTAALVSDLHSEPFLAFLERVTGLSDLLADPHLEGGCLHRVQPGGSLNVHTDFLSHSKERTWSRQLNLLLYFNRSWESQWNGDLELWEPDLSMCGRSISPDFNRCVIFKTDPDSLHGHPRPLSCPPGESRKSMALYYFRDEGARQELKPTRYHALPSDPAYKRWLVKADSALLRAYAVLKRSTPLTDRMTSRILKHL